MQNVAELLRDRAEVHPHFEHLRYREEGRVKSMDRASFAMLAGGWAEILRRKGCGPKKRVVLISEKSPQQMRAFFAIFSTGATAVPICEELPPEEIRFLVEDAEPALVLVSQSCESKVRGAVQNVAVLSMSELPPEARAPYRPSPSGPDDVACIIYTSGSTGRPKGVMLTHKNFISNSASSAELFDAGPQDVVMSVLPYWHSFALTVELFTLLWVEGAVAIPADKKDFASNVADYRPTIILIVPRIAELLRRSVDGALGSLSPLRRKLFQAAYANACRVCTDGPQEAGSVVDRVLRRIFLATVLKKIKNHFGGRLRFFVSGGAPLHKDYQIHFKRLGIPIFQGYGLTECSPVVSAASFQSHKLGTAGRMASWLSPEKGGDWIFEDDAGRRSKKIRGELLVRGDCVMKGYWRRPEETRAAFSDGWLRTGDLGEVDSDGFLSLTGRRSNLVCLVGGEKFHPEPVESILKLSPYISDCLVYGESRKNAYALIVPDEERTSGIGPSELRELVKNEIERLLKDSPRHWRPRDFEFVEPFSLEEGLVTPTLKLKREKILVRYKKIVEALDVRNGEFLKQKAY